MKLSKILTVVAATALSIGAYSAGRVGVTYVQNENKEMRGLMQLMDAYQIKAVIHAEESAYKFYEVLMNVRKGDSTEVSLLGFVPIEPDSTEIVVSAAALDSTRCAVSIVPGGILRKIVEIPTTQCLLIDTPVKAGYAAGDTISLMAYSQGIHKLFNLGNGRTADAYDICGLRFSEVSPNEWRKDFGVDNYIYFQAIPVLKPDYDKFMNE